MASLLERAGTNAAQRPQDLRTDDFLSYNCKNQNAQSVQQAHWLSTQGVMHIEGEDVVIVPI